MLKEYLECGKIINKRGFGGELKLLMLCDGIEALDNVTVLYSDNEGKNEHKVVSIKTYKGFLYIKLEDITDGGMADAMRGKTLYARREDLIIDESRVYITDLLGLEVIDADSGRIYGKVKDIFNSGSADIYTVVCDGKEVLMPATPDILVSAEAGEKILVRPIPGIFDDAEEIK